MDGQSLDEDEDENMLIILSWIQAQADVHPGRLQTASTVIEVFGPDGLSVRR